MMRRNDSVVSPLSSISPISLNLIYRARLGFQCGVWGWNVEQIKGYR
jgi:hypothetical protein